MLAPAAQLYDLSAPIDPPTQLAAYAAAVDDAVAAGFTGLRVVADITPLVEDPARRGSHAHWEQVADRYIATHPLTPLCMYDATRVGSLAWIACVHPLQGPEATPFSLAATDPTTAALVGEVDATIADVLAVVLRVLPRTDDAIDVSALTFADGHAAATLHRELTRRGEAGQRIRLVGASTILRRLWDACGFDAAYLAA